MYVFLCLFLFIDKKMESYEVNENAVLEKLSEVTAAKRAASMVSNNYSTNVFFYSVNSLYVIF